MAIVMGEDFEYILYWSFKFKKFSLEYRQCWYKF